MYRILLNYAFQCLKYLKPINSWKLFVYLKNIFENDTYVTNSHNSNFIATFSWQFECQPLLGRDNTIIVELHSCKNELDKLHVGSDGAGFDWFDIHLRQPREFR